MAGTTLDVESHRLVFVSGLHRSGTTVLAGALGQHPDVSGLTGTGVIENEGQFLQDVYPLARVYGGPGRFAWDRRAHMTEASPLATSHNAAKLITAWSPYWDLRRRLLVEKSPPNLLKTRFLQALFPQAAHVVVVRHPVVVALATRKWARNIPLATLVRHNLRAYELFMADAPYLDRLCVLRYEELVGEPSAALATVSKFLHLASAIPADRIRPGHDSGYVDAWASLARGRGLTARRWRRFRAVQSAGMEELGYDVDDPASLLPWPQRPGTASL